ncbi:MAG: hypothetical protein J6K32_08705 [Clostridia bacterium]|nr:hypothetical protein [Clostridia bacterium]
MEQNEQMERPTRREHAANADSISQAMRVIDTIEQMINEGSRVPLWKDRCIVEQARLIDLIGQLHIVLPKTVQQAHEIMQRSEEIITTAKTEADRIADEADKYHRETIETAKKTSDEIRADADAYCQNVSQQAADAANAAVADAQSRAEQIIYAAQMQAQQLVDESEITRRAQAEALELRDRAQKDAASIYNQACVHADKLLSGAAAAFSRSASELAALRDSLLGGASNPDDTMY